MSKTILYIDGENLKHYITTVLVDNGIKKDTIALEKLDWTNLFKKALKGIKISRKIYYVAKLHENQETLKKSKELIKKQRVLKTTLEKQGFNFLLQGNVRAQKVKVNKRHKTIFREKGVDVKIAVDLVVAACDKKIKTAIICSSDSDLQPAVQELKKRKVETIYLGFEINPNKGLIYSTDRTILLRNTEILETYNNK